MLHSPSHARKTVADRAFAPHREEASRGLSRRATIVLAVLLALAPSFDRDLHEPDEGRYAEIAREMVMSGDWLVPRFEGVEHLAKPPLTYWMSAIGITAFGDTAFGARALVVVAGLLTTLVVMDLAARLGTPAEGNLAAIVYATSLTPFVLGHYLSTDVFVTLWQVAGVAAAVRAWRSDPARSRRWALASWLCFGLAFMTKGPPGLLALVPVAVIDVRRERRNERPRVWSWTGAFLCAAVGLWWYLVMIAQDAGRLRYFVVGEVWDRVFTDAHHRENTPWIHVGALVAGTLPWTFGYLGVARAGWSWWRSRPHRVDDVALLLCCWIVPALVLFLIAKSRLPLYTAPLLAPISVMFARTWLRRPEGPPRIARSLPAIAVFGAILVVGLHFLRTSRGVPELRAAAEAVRGDKRGEATILNATGTPHGSIAFFAGRDVEIRPSSHVPPADRDVYLVRSVKGAAPVPGPGAPAAEIYRGQHLEVLRLRRREK